MLMNLTRLRRSNWEKRLTSTYDAYKHTLQFPDQDLLNIIFNNSPAGCHYKRTINGHYIQLYALKTVAEYHVLFDFLVFFWLRWLFVLESCCFLCFAVYLELMVFSCKWNFRPLSSHCVLSKGECEEAVRDGVKLVHGNGGLLHSGPKAMHTHGLYRAFNNVRERQLHP